MIQCFNKEPEKAMTAFQEQFSELAEDTFIFTYDRMRRYQGEWHVETWPMFPGCFFAAADSEALAALKVQNTKIIPLTSEDEKLLRDLGERSHHIKMSQGYIQSGKTYVTSGPLRGREHLIQKIDRHKRLARVILPGEGNGREVCVGVEIVEKRG